MKDNLDVPQFKNESSVKMNYINKAATKKIAKRKIKLGRVMGILALAGGITWIVGTAIDSNNYEQVEHKFDTYDTAEGKLEHNHELNKKYFVGDYKIVNPAATDEDVLDAIYDGEYDYYVHHEGKIKIDKELQGESLENDDVIDFSEQFLAQHGGKGSK